jgi:hypothetical protein
MRTFFPSSSDLKTMGVSIEASGPPRGSGGPARDVVARPFSKETLTY